MNATLAVIASRLQRVFFSLSDQAAVRSRLIRRRRKFFPVCLALSLTLAWLQHPQASYSQLLAFVALAGCSVCPSALCQRFNSALADFFLRLLRQAVSLALRPRPANLPLLRRFNGVFLYDSTVLRMPDGLASIWPSCGGDAGRAALKVSVRAELTGGELQLSLEPGRQGDAGSPLLTQALPQGALVLADLAYFNLRRLADWSTAGVFWISRARALLNVTVGELYQPLADYLGRQRRSGCLRLEEWLQIGTRDLPARLIAVRCPPEVEARRRQRLYHQASKRGSVPKKAALELCGWTAFLTNVPEEMLSGRETWVVYRLRWQVELLFKRWKSLGGLGRSRGEKEQRLVVEVYAKLLGALLRSWLALTAGQGWQLGCSAYRREAVIQSWGLTLLRAMGHFSSLLGVLADLGEVLRNTPNIERRKGRPSAFQTLEDPENDSLVDTG